MECRTNTIIYMLSKRNEEIIKKREKDRERDKERERGRERESSPGE